MDKTEISECTKMSFANVPFPEVIKRLGGAGVRSYRADLVRRHTLYDGGGGETYDSPLPLTEAPPIGDAFEEAEIAASVRAIQRGALGYAEFLRRIMQAGCASYCVFIAGRKVIYFGKDGAFYLEPFPAPQR
jgi:uncharacterized protein YbcV (DUF1398 family)